MEFKELLEQSKEGDKEPLIVLKFSEFKYMCPYRIIGGTCCTFDGIGKTCEPINCRYVNAKFKEDQHEEG